MKSLKDLLGFVFYSSCIIALAGTILCIIFFIPFAPQRYHEEQMIPTYCNYSRFGPKVPIPNNFTRNIILPPSYDKIKDVDKQDCLSWSAKKECTYIFGKQQRANRTRYYYTMNYYNKIIVIPRALDDKTFASRLGQKEFCLYDKETVEVTRVSDFWQFYLKIFGMWAVFGWLVFFICTGTMTCLKKRQLVINQNEAGQALPIVAGYTPLV